jgi:anti-sigma regulatory factor (Ser/Thr protein kinase)
MKTSLICEYDISALPVITAFVKGGASAVGASQGEAGHIELAAEEVAVHVISSYLEQFDSESFVISCETKDSGLLFSFEDKGFP